MCPRSGFLGPGMFEIIAFICQGSTAGKDFLEEIFEYRGTSAKTNLFKLDPQPFCEPPTLDASFVALSDHDSMP